MTHEFLRWDDFFMGTLLRLRGEGTVAELLRADGALGSFDWCRNWARGETTVMQSLESQLAKAERDLAEAVAGEDHKAQVIRLCPHCSIQFVVRERNCGTFVCGRDYHSDKESHGCGKTFAIDEAPRYKANEFFLESLRRIVEEDRDRLNCGQEWAPLWTRAREFKPPVLDFFVSKTAILEPMLPTAYIFQLDGPMDDAMSNNLSLFQLLEQSSSLVDQLKVLPDLIEFYVWLHSTFKHLVTKERAFSLTMNDVVTKERLRSRFDLIHADHVETLWSRVKQGFDRLLELMDRKTHWQCEEITIPFQRLEEASMMQLLSERNHPTEGNDYLFLMINDIIEQYNTFVRRVSELKIARSETVSDDIHPKFVVLGNGGASQICAVPVLPHSELKIMVASAWDEIEEAFDIPLLRNMLHQRLFLDGIPPAIMNPTKYLREVFLFRDDSDTNPSRQKVTGGVSRSGKGDFFANSQDLSLYNDVSQLLDVFGMPMGSGDLSRTLSDHFHCCSYEELRSSLEGVRNVLQMLQTAGTDYIGIFDDALRRATNVTPEELILQGTVVLSQLGFPEFGSSQRQLIMSLTESQLVDFVQFLGYQLASEAYIFASLPLCMTEPLSEVDHDAVVKGLKAFYEENGFVRADERFEEFVRDVLGYYEIEISKRALSVGQQRLREFLVEHHCCDVTDPMYSLLPDGLRVRNYVAVRKIFHQTRLEMRFSMEDRGRCT